MNKKLVPCLISLSGQLSTDTHLSAFVSCLPVSVTWGFIYLSPHCVWSFLVKAAREVQVLEITENSAKLHWERPEPPSPYFYDLTVTSAHDQSLVLKQNLTVTDRAIGGLHAGHTYHVVVICYLRSQVKAIYRGSFSTSEYGVRLRKVGT